eukprot:1688029-Lingulodinium_polyedra.AAC.1
MRRGHRRYLDWGAHPDGLGRRRGLDPRSQDRGTSGRTDRLLGAASVVDRRAVRSYAGKLNCVAGLAPTIRP